MGKRRKIIIQHIDIIMYILYLYAPFNIFFFNLNFIDKLISQNQVIRFISFSSI